MNSKKPYNVLWEFMGTMLLCMYNKNGLYFSWCFSLAVYNVYIVVKNTDGRDKYIGVKLHDNGWSIFQNKSLVSSTLLYCVAFIREPVLNRKLNEADCMMTLEEHFFEVR